MTGDRRPIDDLLDDCGDLSADARTEAVESFREAVGDLYRNGKADGREKLLLDRATNRLKQVNWISAPKEILRRAIGRSTSTGGHDVDDRQGSSVSLAEPEPWADPVDGRAVLDELVDLFERYLVLPAGAAVAAALWVVHTYALKSASVSPILAFTSPLHRCGKTRFLELLQALVWKGLFTSDLTPATTYRVIETYQPTLLVDEQDTISDHLRRILNAGHKRRTATVLRCAGDDYEVRGFSAWTAKAIGLIGALPDTLDDRSIEVRMFRRAPDEKIDSMPESVLNGIADGPLPRQICRWAADHVESLRSSHPEVPDSLNDRETDNWTPLFAIAEVAGGDWPKKAQKAAKKLSGTERDESHREQLLRDIKNVFEGEDADRLPSKELCRKLRQREDRPWRTWGRRDQGLSPVSLAEQLKRFDKPNGQPIRPKTIRFDDTTAKGYKKAWFKDAWKRYVPERGRNTRNISDGTGNNHEQEVVTAGDRVTGSSNPEVQEVTGDVTAVTGSAVGTQENQNGPGNTCRECAEPIGPTAVLCGSCKQERWEAEQEAGG